MSARTMQSASSLSLFKVGVDHMDLVVVIRRGYFRHKGAKFVRGSVSPFETDFVSELHNLN